uniref:Uncharacterized protein n=1 Tax=Mastacembelus armatus TaxID=205130 RepID=A0A3Q3N1L2_9TELE
MTKYTGLWDPTTVAFSYLDSTRRQWWSKVNFQRDFSPSSNPLSLSFGQLSNSSYNWSVAYFFLGVDISGKDPLELIRVNFLDPPPNKNTSLLSLPVPAPSSEPNSTIIDKVIAVDYSTLKPLDIMELATGYSEENLWLSWMVQNAKEQPVGDCVACASARPHLRTEPSPLFPEDEWGYGCMIGLTRAATPANCTTLASIFPPIDNKIKTGPFTPDKGNGSYVCFTITHPSPSVALGQIPWDWCNHTLSGSVLGSWARAGLYYYCGGRRLLVRLPPAGVGICAMVRLSAPLVLVGNRLVSSGPGVSPPALTARRRRHVLSKREVTSQYFDLSVGSPTYIDAIGVPRGVPNEYKLVDQIAAGFENLPIISALFSITPSKNVDRINYVHYNVLRLANLTRDAVEGLAEQAGPTSLMSVQCHYWFRFLSL